jgi:hypothetical protein
MDILNFISWIASKRRVVKTLNKTDLIPLGVRTETRDDKYTTVAITTEDFIAQIPIPVPTYKVYTALLTQVGINPPVATVLENTIGNITWTYLGTGSYAGNLISAFPLNKTYFSVNNRFSDDGGASAYDAFLFRADDDLFGLTLWNNGTPSDNLIFSGAPISIEIRVYN